MPAESLIFEQQEAVALRRRVGNIARQALDKLQAELKEYDATSISETWARKFKIVADQIRRDYRLEGEDLPPAAEESNADPLGALRVVTEDEEAA